MSPTFRKFGESCPELGEHLPSGFFPGVRCEYLGVCREAGRPDLLLMWADYAGEELEFSHRNLCWGIWDERLWLPEFVGERSPLMADGFFSRVMNWPLLLGILGERPWSWRDLGEVATFAGVTDAELEKQETRVKTAGKQE